MSLSSDRPIIFAHRGASGYEYENSFSAFDYAVVLGADGIETDCWLSKDKEVIIHHDLLLRSFQTSQRELKYNIQQMNLREIQRLKLPNGEKILSLRELFDHFGSNHSYSNRLNLLKFSIDVQDNNVGREIAKLVEEYDLVDRVDICCDSLWKLRNIRKVNQQVRLVASSLEYMIRPKYLRLNGKMDSLNIQAFNIKAENFYPRIKKLLDDYNFKYYIWDLHSSRVLRNYLPYFPKAIYSNFPDKALKALKSIN